jgi:hypothetical protein
VGRRFAPLGWGAHLPREDDPYHRLLAESGELQMTTFIRAKIIKETTATLLSCRHSWPRPASGGRPFQTADHMSDQVKVLLIQIFFLQKEIKQIL